MDKLRLVLDTNIIISAIINRTTPPAIVTSHALYETTLLISDELIAELVKVLFRKKFRKYFSETFAKEYVHLIRRLSEEVTIYERLTVCRDEFDNHLLELASAGNADYLITGDADLLVLKKFRNTVICDANTFIVQVLS